MVLPEQSQAMAYKTCGMVKRLTCKQLCLNHVVPECTKELRPKHPPLYQGDARNLIMSSRQTFSFPKVTAVFDIACEHRQLSGSCFMQLKTRMRRSWQRFI